MNLLQTIADGKIPEVPFTVKVEDSSIAKLAVAAVITALVIMLAAALIRKKK